MKLRPAEGQHELYSNAHYCWFGWVPDVGRGTLPEGSMDQACSAVGGCYVFQSQECGQPVLSLWESGAFLATWVMLNDSVPVCISAVPHHYPVSRQFCTSIH